MRYAWDVRLALVLLIVAACGDSSATGYGTKGVGDPAAGPVRDGEDVDADAGSPLDDDGDLPASTDTDADGTPDALDCDPASPALRRRIVEDDLATDKALFLPADGFPAASWAHDGAAYRQSRLLDASDASLYVNDADIGDVQVEVRAASTEVGALTPRLRQIFVVVGASVTGGSLLAHGCGIEVVGGETPEAKTSIVKLEGPETNVVTTMLQRVTRPSVQVNEEFAIRLRIEDGAMTCDVTQGPQGSAITTTATANGLVGVRGRFGLYTRQTKALFKNVRVCSLK
jgi:hypothetical protein